MAKDRARLEVSDDLAPRRRASTAFLEARFPDAEPHFVPTGGRRASRRLPSVARHRPNGRGQIQTLESPENPGRFITTNTSGSQWVEIGLRNGYDPSDPCVCNAYEAFWAEFDQYNNEYRHTIQNTIDNHTTHNYEIQRGSAQNSWDVYRDYNYVGTSQYQNSWVGYQHQGGGEIALTGSLSPVAYSETFNMYFQNKNSSGSWYYWPSQQNYHDNPCGTGTYASGYCTNGATYNTYEWSWNKP